MAALTADANCSTVGPVGIAPFSANVADTYFKGSLVFIDAAGGVQLVPVSGDRFLGVSPKNQVIAAAGDEVAVVVTGMVWLPVAGSVAAADEFDALIINLDGTLSDNPADAESVGDATGADGDMGVGTILRVTATQMLILLDMTGKGFLAPATAGETSGWF